MLVWVQSFEGEKLTLTAAVHLDTLRRHRYAQAVKATAEATTADEGGGEEAAGQGEEEGETGEGAVAGEGGATTSPDTKPLVMLDESIVAGRGRLGVCMGEINEALEELRYELEE